MASVRGAPRSIWRTPVRRRLNMTTFIDCSPGYESDPGPKSRSNNTTDRELLVALVPTYDRRKRALRCECPALTGFALIEIVKMHNAGRQFKELRAREGAFRVNL